MKIFSMLSRDELPQFCYDCGENGSYRSLGKDEFKCAHCGAIYKYKGMKHGELNGRNFKNNA